MSKMKSAAVALWKGEEGLTVVEYAIAGGLVGLGVVVAFTNLGLAVAGVINQLIAAIS